MLISPVALPPSSEIQGGLRKEVSLSKDSLNYLCFIPSSLEWSVYLDEGGGGGAGVEGAQAVEIFLLEAAHLQD